MRTNTLSLSLSHTYTGLLEPPAAHWLTHGLGGGPDFRKVGVVHVPFPAPAVNSRETAMK